MAHPHGENNVLHTLLTQMLTHPKVTPPRSSQNQIMHLGTPSSVTLTHKIHHHRGDEKGLDKNGSGGCISGTHLMSLNDAHTDDSTIKTVLNVFHHNFLKHTKHVFRVANFIGFFFFKRSISIHFGSIHAKIGTIQKKLAWPLPMQICEAFHFF